MDLIIKSVRTQYYSEENLVKLRESLDHLRLAINSVQFRARIFSHTPFNTPQRYNNRQIYEIIMSGKEIRTEIDNEADLDLTLDSRHSSDIIGYTRDTKIFTFRNMFDSLSPWHLAGHYAHEYCHTLNFYDPADFNEIESNVPYEVGRIIASGMMENRLEITNELAEEPHVNRLIRV